MPSATCNPSQKRSFSKTLFKPEEFENADFAFLVWTENVLKTDLFETDDVAINIWLYSTGLVHLQFQNDGGLLRFEISPA